MGLETVEVSGEEIKVGMMEGLNVEETLVFDDGIKVRVDVGTFV